MANDDEQVVPGADASFESGAAEHDTVIHAMRMKYRASSAELVPSVVELGSRDISALGLDQPVTVLEMVAAPQVGPKVFLPLGRLCSCGWFLDVQGPAVLDVPCLAEAHQRAAGPFCQRHAQPVAEGADGAGFGTVFEHDVCGQPSSGVVLVKAVSVV
ncbi:hypothetical protein ABZV34_25130 [Streptomyces sp. NPDC005195]|uniref:hypothetical protein n=1 Tax=Streptomyces sp. NPDC005195 TaxID=3154561 RepID=UPI0033B36B37